MQSKGLQLVRCAESFYQRALQSSLREFVKNIGITNMKYLVHILLTNKSGREELRLIEVKTNNQRSARLQAEKHALENYEGLFHRTVKIQKI